MYILRFVVLWILIFLLVSACGSETGDAAPQKSAIVEPDPAELALLMKDIHEDAKIWRTALLRDSLFLDSLDIYLRMVNATPTDSTVTGPVFAGFASHYQSAFDQLVAATRREGAKEAYNSLVKSCVTCHQTYCPGPIPTIEKLYVPLP